MWRMGVNPLFQEPTSPICGLNEKTGMTKPLPISLTIVDPNLSESMPLSRIACITADNRRQD
jgi:hypothetical protein